MTNKVINVSIITLAKNDPEKFYRTLKSINSQKILLSIEWIIIDGSEFLIQKKHLNLISKYFSIKLKNYVYVKHINSNDKDLKGIYPCMNYAKKIAKGNHIIFLNSGDKFFNKYSLDSLMKKTKIISQKDSLVFGQANIIASKKIKWLFPGKNLKSFKKWLVLFEPNHQSMLISKSLASKFDFLENHSIISDGYWKRKIINRSKEIIYINKPVINFYLDGVSSSKPTQKVISEILSNENIPIKRKLIFLIKYILPENLFFLYYRLQKCKSYIFDLIL